MAELLGSQFLLETHHVGPAFAQVEGNGPARGEDRRGDAEAIRSAIASAAAASSVVGTTRVTRPSS